MNNISKSTARRDLRISLYSVQIWENTDQNNSEYGHVSRSKKSWLDWIWIYTSIIASSWYISLQQNFFHEYFRIFKYVNNHWLEIYKIDLWSRFHVVYKECHCEIMLFLFEKNWKNKKLIMKHLDLSCKINIGYPVLYLQKLFICRKFSVVLSCFITKYAWWNVLWKKSYCEAHLPGTFFYNVSSITVIVFCLLKDLRGKPFLWLLSYEGTCKHGTIIRTGKKCKKIVL